MKKPTEPTTSIRIHTKTKKLLNELREEYNQEPPRVNHMGFVEYLAYRYKATLTARKP